MYKRFGIFAVKTKKRKSSIYVSGKLVIETDSSVGKGEPLVFSEAIKVLEDYAQENLGLLEECSVGSVGDWFIKITYDTKSGFYGYDIELFDQTVATSKHCYTEPQQAAEEANKFLTSMFNSCLDAINKYHEG